MTLAWQLTDRILMAHQRRSGHPISADLPIKLEALIDQLIDEEEPWKDRVKAAKDTYKLLKTAKVVR